MLCNVLKVQSDTTCFCIGKDWTLDNDYGSAPADTAAAYLAMLSIDCLLNTVAALEKLTDVAVDGVAVTPDAASGALLTLILCSCLLL